MGPPPEPELLDGGRVDEFQAFSLPLRLFLVSSSVLEATSPLAAGHFPNATHP